MKLIEPTREYCREIEAYRNAFIECGDSMDGTGGLEQFDHREDWISYLDRYRDPLTVPNGRVPSSQFIFVREEDNIIVGMIDIRHTLNEYPETYGGHIGYSVAPGERRRGYASEMLKEALIKCREPGIKKVLITCTDNNEGSRKTILANGGIYESSVYEPEEKISSERYWITVFE